MPLSPWTEGPRAGLGGGGGSGPTELESVMDSFIYRIAREGGVRVDSVRKYLSGRSVSRFAERRIVEAVTKLGLEAEANRYAGVRR